MPRSRLRATGINPTSKSTKNRRVLACASAAALLLVTSRFAGATVSINTTSPNFDIALIPDTQEYTIKPSWNAAFVAQMNWVVNNTAASNIAYTIGLGDVVQDGVALGPDNNTAPYATILTEAPNGNLTDAQMQVLTGHAAPYTQDEYMTEWHTADNDYKILDTNGVPYYAGIGRHDYWHWGLAGSTAAHNTSQVFTHFFGSQRYTNPNNVVTGSPVNTSQTTLNPGQGGGTGISDQQNADLNAYSVFSAGGYKFLQIYLQFDPALSDLQWAQSIVNAHPGMPTIVSTADAFDPHAAASGFYRNVSGQFIWDNLVNNNKQIFMFLGGHIDTSINAEPTDAAGLPVLQILTDYETDGDFGGTIEGGGVMRTLAFNLTNDTVTAKSFTSMPAPYVDPAAGSGFNANDFTISLGNFQARFPLGPYTWDPGKTGTAGGGGSGTWDASTTANWFNGSTDVTWANAATAPNAIFSGTGGTVTVAAGGVSADSLTFNSTYTTTGGTITLTNAATVQGSPSTTTINNVIAGTNGLNITGGAITLGGANTFTGGLSISGGAFVHFSTDANLGAAGQGVTLNGCTLSYTGSTTPTLTRVFTIGANGGQFNTVNAGATGKLIINGSNLLVGSGQIVKTGPGWLTLYGDNSASFSGPWNISGGVVEAGSANVLGSGVVNVNNGGELASNVAGTVPNAIVMNTGSTIGADFTTANSSSTYSGNINAAGNFSVRLGNFYNTTSQNVVLSGAVSGAGSLTTINASGATSSTGMLTLSGNNSGFTGGIVIPTGAVSPSVTATANFPLGHGTITLSGGKLALAGQSTADGARGPLAPITVTGYNADVIYGNPDTGGTVTGGIDNVFGFFKNGYTPPTGSLNAGTALTGGLASNSITSTTTNSITGTHTPFTLQSFTANNAVKAAQGTSATMTLATPTIYSTLEVLATSSFALDDTPNVTINFADGKSVTTTYNAYDWSIGTDTTKQAASVFGSAGVNRYSPTQTPGWDQRPFGMYETDIDMTNINNVDYSYEKVSSVTFTATNSDTQGRGSTSILALSGSAAVAGTGGTYQSYDNNLNVTASSTIDVSGGRNAFFRNLTIGAVTLTVTSGDTTGKPYSLNFQSTTQNGSPIFNIQPSAGGGTGHIVMSDGLTALPTSLVAGGSTSAATSSLRSFQSLSVVSGVLAFTPHAAGAAPGVTVVSALNLSGTGTLDLGNNDLIIHNGDLAGITHQLSSGLRSGVGLVTTASQEGSSSNAALGIIQNTNGARTSFDGQPVGDSDVIVKSTVFGDADLNGSVDSTDLAQIDNGFSEGLTGWQNGDFNYDGVINGSDFALIDNTFNQQSTTRLTADLTVPDASPTSLIATSAAISAVPEPTSLTLLALGALSCIQGRSRRPR